MANRGAAPHHAPRASVKTRDTTGGEGVEVKMTVHTTPHGKSVSQGALDSRDDHIRYGHAPVMRDRVTEHLAPAVIGDDHPVIIDATLGAGGHSEYFLRTWDHCLVVGVDRDIHALRGATERLKPFGARFQPIHARFDEAFEVLAQLDSPVAEHVRTAGLAASLCDFGVSSMQLDQAERGFSYSIDAPLDMRMDDSQTLSAADVLNTYSHGDLARVLSDYGEERFAGRIASAIVAERTATPFHTSAQLVELLYRVIPAPARRSGGHPAKRTFQALRVEVNSELMAIRRVIPQIAESLHEGGRMVFMSYQSLEDKIVKSTLARLTTSTTPPGLPVDLPGTEPAFSLLTRGAERATREEIEHNSRAASVRVRAAEKTRNERSRP